MKFKCIKDTVGFVKGNVYVTEDGYLKAMNEEGNTVICWSVDFVQDELSDYFERVTESNYFIGYDGSVRLLDQFSKTSVAKWNVFDSEKSAKMEILRRESMSIGWVPKIGNKYWTYNVGNYMLEECEYGRERLHRMNAMIGNCHKTKEQALDWSMKYAPAFYNLIGL